VCEDSSIRVTAGWVIAFDKPSLVPFPNPHSAVADVAKETVVDCLVSLPPAEKDVRTLMRGAPGYVGDQFIVEVNETVGPRDIRILDVEITSVDDVLWPLNWWRGQTVAKCSARGARSAPNGCKTLTHRLPPIHHRTMRSETDTVRVPPPGVNQVTHEVTPAGPFLRALWVQHETVRRP
jgi:hypothetical protein